MNLDLIPFTKEGHDLLQKELEELKSKERPAIIEAIAEARDHGDLKENAEYHAAREKQGLIEARIADLDDKLSRAQIIDHSDQPQDTVKFGAWVSICDEETGETKRFRIVGDLEANINESKLSVSSPMARSILGKKIDDLVEIKAPGGMKEYIIEEIEYSS